MSQPCKSKDAEAIPVLAPRPCFPWDTGTTCWFQKPRVQHFTTQSKTLQQLQCCCTHFLALEDAFSWLFPDINDTCYLPARAASFSRLTVAGLGIATCCTAGCLSETEPAAPANLRSLSPGEDLRELHLFTRASQAGQDITILHRELQNLRLQETSHQKPKNRIRLFSTQSWQPASV